MRSKSYPRKPFHGMVSVPWGIAVPKRAGREKAVIDGSVLFLVSGGGRGTARLFLILTSVAGFGAIR